MVCEFPLEWVEMPAGYIHLRWLVSLIQQEQLVLLPVCVGRLNAGLRPGAKELFQPGVPERADHIRECIA
jgi:hypothetical protein